MNEGVQKDDLGNIIETKTGGKEFQGSVETPDPMTRRAVPAPDGIPEKFWDGEKGELRTDALLKSYTELEKQLGGGDPNPNPDPNPDPDPEDQGYPDPDPEGDPNGEPEDPKGGEKGDEDGEKGDKEEVSDLSAKQAEAVNAAQEYYAEHGDLSEEVIESLEQVGYTRQQVSLYMAGVKAQEAALIKIAEDAAGSLEDYQKAVLWAAENWSEKQIATFDGQISDLETAKMAAMGLVADYRKNNPGEGKLATMTTGMNRGDVYNSMEEYDADLAKAGNSREKRRAAVEKYRRSLKAKTITPVRTSPFGR